MPRLLHKEFKKNTGLCVQKEPHFTYRDVTDSIKPLDAICQQIKGSRIVDEYSDYSEYRKGPTNASDLLKLVHIYAVPTEKGLVVVENIADAAELHGVSTELLYCGEVPEELVNKYKELYKSL